MFTSASKAQTDVRRQCKRYTWSKALSAAEGVQPTTNVARTPSEKNVVTTSNLPASIDNKRNQQATCKANSKTPCTHGPKRPSTNVATRASHRHNKQCSKHTQHTESSGQVQSRSTNIATRASQRRNKQRSNHTQHTESSGQVQSKLKNPTHNQPKTTIDQCSNQGLTSSQQAM